MAERSKRTGNREGRSSLKTVFHSCSDCAIFRGKGKGSPRKKCPDSFYFVIKGRRLYDIWRGVFDPACHWH